MGDLTRSKPLNLAADAPRDTAASDRDEAIPEKPPPPLDEGILVGTVDQERALARDSSSGFSGVYLSLLENICKNLI